MTPFWAATRHGNMFETYNGYLALSPAPAPAPGSASASAHGTGKRLEQGISHLIFGRLGIR